MIIDLDGVKILLTHGDHFGVKQSLLQLFYRAKEVGAQLVFYGHTHIASIDEIEGIKFINPGCMNKFSQNSYCYVVIYNGKITEKFVSI